MSLPESLEHAATELASLADQIRPANGDPHRLLEELDADQARELLRWVLDHETGAAEELVSAWCEDEAGAAVLLGVSDAGVAKAGRKILRKAHHRLRSQGLQVASTPAGTPVPRRAPARADHWEAAHLSAPDFRGTRMAYLADTHPAGGARLFEIRFDEARGILDFKVYNAGRSKVRGFLRSLTAGNAQRLFEVDRKALCALVRRASLAQAADRPLPTAFVEWRGRLFPESLEKEKTPGECARAALGTGSVPEEALQTALSEIEAGRLGPWPPATTWVAEWMEKGRAAVDALEGAARAAAIESWWDRLVAALESESRRDLIARHLEEVAWIRWRAGAEGEARALLAAADEASSDAEAWRRLTASRADALFAPFLAELRVVEESPLGDPDGAS